MKFRIRCDSYNVQDESPQEGNIQTAVPAQFGYAEINTSPLLKVLNPKEPDPDDSPAVFNSLLIDIFTGDGSTWLELVFEQVDVVPDEPLAFSLMESDPRFEVPVFRPEAPEASE